jgi:hypothetical protein
MLKSQSYLKEVVMFNSDNDVKAGKLIPPTLLLAEPTEKIQVTGFYDSASETWSNREYDCAARKKHNEAM